MITRIVKLPLDPKHARAFELLFLEKVGIIKGSPGCYTVELKQSISQPGLFFTISTWASEDDLNNYRNSSVFGTIWPTVKNWMIDKPEAWSLS